MARGRMTLQAWRIAFYLEGHQWLNSLKRTLQNPIGLMGVIIALIAVMGGLWFYFQYYLYRRPLQPSEAIWVDISSPERLLVSQLMLVAIAFLHLLIALVITGFRPYQFLRAFSASDLHFLFATPLNSWRLIRAILLMRATITLGIWIPIYLVSAIAMASQIIPVLIRDYIEQLRSGAWLLIGYWVLRYVQGLFFEFFSFYWALMLRRRPRLRWLMLVIACLWLGLLILAVVSGARIAIAHGMDRLSVLAYALNWLPTQILSLPARATADAVLSVVHGWTPAMGIMLMLWVTGCIWLARYLTRHSAEIVDMIAIGVQLGAGAKAGESEEGIPHTVRQILEQARQKGTEGFRTPAWLDHWQPGGVYALLWRDLIINFRTTPAWMAVFGLIVLIGIMAAMPLLAKHAVRSPIDDSTIVLISQLIPFLFIILSIIEYTRQYKIYQYFDITRSLPFTAEQQVRYYTIFTVSAICVPFLLPACVSGLLIYPKIWYLWLGSLPLLVSYTLSVVLLSFVGDLLTAQPYLTPVETVFSAIRGFAILILAIVGFAVFWLALSLGAWFPLIALLIGLICLPGQLYLLQVAAELWRNYTPLV